MQEKNLNYSFSQVFNSHKGNYADKWEGYLFVYDEIFLNWKCKELSLLEIGVDNGGSLEIFYKFFNNIKAIVGVDINEKCRDIEMKDKGIEIIIGDAKSISTRENIEKISSTFDIIIDDGSHISSDIISNFVNLVELVSYGGLYIIEDLCCSYWKSYGGGLNNQLSAINFFKKLIDIINHQHWDEKFSIEDFFKKIGIDNINEKALHKLTFLKNITFFNSMCVLEFYDFSYKKGIGKRLCRGVPNININVGSNGDDINDISPNQK